ncbi:UNVERIFIED_CONTAM: mariner\T [Trichonephila clavipes]
MLSGEVIILHDNARSHVAVTCQTLLLQFRWEVLERLSYIPDFSLCEFHIFGSLQKALEGWLQAAVENWFHNHTGVSSPRLFVMWIAGILVFTFKVTLSSLSDTSVQWVIG